MRRVILESPYAGPTAQDVEANVAYARLCVRDCLLRGESAIASHLLFTQPGILRDADQAERSLGMRAGMAWTQVADAVVVYTDRGVSPGMKTGITRAKKLGLPVEERTLPEVLTQAAAAEVEPTPRDLHNLLITIGHDVTARDLAAAAKGPDDVRAAVEWAKAEHDFAQGIESDAPRPACPTWLEDLLEPLPETDR